MEQKQKKKGNPPAVAGEVRPGRCWLRARCRCAARSVEPIAR
jgi:hypothetical protein